MTSESEHQPILQPVQEHLEQQDETAKEDFYQALSLIEQFHEALNQLQELEKELPQRHQGELEATRKELESLVDVLDSESSPVEIVQSQNLSGVLRRSKVERLGIAGELVRARREEKATLRELSERFGLNARCIGRFFRYYDSLQPSQKSKYQRKSVFEVTERLEELQTEILRNFKRLEGTRDEVAVKYIGELRQTLELAVKVADRINDAKEMRRQYEEFKQVVYDIFAQDLKDQPQLRDQILDKLKRINDSEKL
ncbi:MAG: hypothetical protein ABEK59_07465 [Halobacteria archaeon]